SALPATVQNQFKAIGGSIVFTKSIGRYCKDSSMSRSGCVSHEYDAATKNLKLTFYQSPDPKMIKHAGIRGFGFLYGQIMWRFQPSSEGIRVVESSPKFTELKLALADTFLEELVAKNHSLSAFEPFFGVGALKKIVNARTDGESA